MTQSFICTKCHRKWIPQYLATDGYPYEGDICNDCWQIEMAKYLGEDIDGKTY